MVDISKWVVDSDWSITINDEESKEKSTRLVDFVVGRRRHINGGGAIVDTIRYCIPIGSEVDKKAINDMSQKILREVKASVWN